MRKQDRKHVVSKRFKAEKVKIDKLRAYDPVEALELVKETSSTNKRSPKPLVRCSASITTLPRRGPGGSTICAESGA
ncbi:MAG: hypothetical protein ACOVT5_07615, partial [Armatimonadaceae bacterium]